MTSLAFVCVQNAGRSQMAAAFAERACRNRGLEDVDIHQGGTEPADHVHDAVRATMAEVGIDLSGTQPREIHPRNLADVDIVITMGCSAEGVCPATFRGDARDWDLPDPADRPPTAVREIRDEIRRRVGSLLDEVDTGSSGPSP